MATTTLREKARPSEIRVVKVEDIRLTVFVRQHLNEGLVAEYRDLYAHGSEGPAITVTEDLELVDGRHRFEAQIQLNRTEVECVFVPNMPKLELMFEALKANMGGSLPPSRADIVGVIRHLIESGSTNNDIQDRFKRLIPAGLVRSYVSEARRNIAESKLMAARKAVLDEDMPFGDAVEKYGVDPRALRVELGERRRARREFDPGDIMMGLSKTAKSRSQKTAVTMKALLDSLNEGTVTYDQVLAILDKEKDLHEKALHTNKGWRKRFAQAAGKPVEDD